MDPQEPSDFRPARRLILLRHAKSDWPAGVDDLYRPLAERGIRDATAVGLALTAIAAPDAVLCSPARRTRQTWRLASQAFAPPPPFRVVPELYSADVATLLDVVHLVPHDVHTVLLIGHEPTMSSGASALAGPGSAADDLVRLKAKYPTSGMAVLRLPDGLAWAGLSPAGAVLEQFVVPRG